MEKQSPVQLVAWIIWWLELVVLVGGLIFSFFGATMMGGLNWTGSMMGGGMMGANHWLFGFGMLMGFFWLAWRVVLQVVGYIAVRGLSDPSNLAWPIVLIVLGLLGAFLFLIPGLWAVILYYQNQNQNQR